MKRKAVVSLVLLVLLLVSVFPLSTFIGAADSQGSPGLLGSQSIVDPTDWWPMFHHDLTHTGYSTSTSPTTNQTLWNYTTGLYVRSSPAVADGLVYVGSEDNKVYALDAVTGVHVWNYTTGDHVDSSPAVVGGVVYVGSEDNKVYALNATTGALVWSYTTGDWVLSSPAVAEGVVYVGSYDYKVYALDATSGMEVWNYTTGNWVLSSPAVAGGVVYVGSNDGNTYALNATTGALVWSKATANYGESSPTVAEGKVYVGSLDGKVYALDPLTGEQVWNYTIGGWVESSPAVAGGFIYVSSRSSRVCALNSATGALVWSYTTGDYIRSSPAVADGMVCVGSSDGKLYALNSTTGTEIWTYTTGAYVDSSPAVADGVVFVGSVDGGVYALSDIRHRVLISEIYYASGGNDLDHEYVELYIWNNITSDLGGWYVTTFDGDKGVLPRIIGLQEFDYVVVHMGNGTDDLNASDGKATVYLNRTEPMLDDAGDQVGLYDSSGILVDFVRYGGGDGGPVLGNWPSDDMGITANYLNESIQILGEDIDNSTNWISSPLSEGEANLYVFWADGVRVEIHDGINFDFSSDWQFDIVPENSKGNPVPPAIVDKIRDYAEYCRKFYKEKGFNEPELGADGDLDIHVAQGETKETTGGTVDGDIFINVGTAPDVTTVCTKFVVEHEMMHAIQQKKEKDEIGAFRRFNTPQQKFFDEGMAMYWGIESTKANFKMTDDQIQLNFLTVGAPNVYQHFRDPVRTRFLYSWLGGYDYYVGAYLFVKFIAQTYGQDKLREIYDRIRNYGSWRTQEEEDWLALDAILDVLNMSLAELIRQWGLWLFNAPKLIGIPPRDSRQMPFSGQPITEEGLLNLGATGIEVITVDTDKPFTIHFDGSADPDSSFVVTVSKIKKDGTAINETYVNYNSFDLLIRDPTEYEKIVIIKSRISNTGTGKYVLRVYPSSDINRDGVVDIYDALLLAKSFGKKTGDTDFNPNADLNRDGIVDIYDAILLANSYGKTG